MVDSTGCLPISTLGLADFYFIHKKVQSECKKNQGWVTEVYVKSYSQAGRLDLYDPDTNTYYEVKSRGAAYNIFGDIRTSTDDQMKFYDQATINSKKVPDAKGLIPTRGNEYVSGSFEYGIWDVNYQMEHPGLIVYTVRPNPERTSKAIVVAGIAVAAMASGGISIPYSAPGFAYLGA